MSKGRRIATVALSGSYALQCDDWLKRGFEESDRSWCSAGKLHRPTARSDRPGTQSPRCSSGSVGGARAGSPGGTDFGILQRQTLRTGTLLVRLYVSRVALLLRGNIATAFHQFLLCVATWHWFDHNPKGIADSLVSNQSNAIGAWFNPEIVRLTGNQFGIPIDGRPVWNVSCPLEGKRMLTGLDMSPSVGVHGWLEDHRPVNGHIRPPCAGNCSNAVNVDRGVPLRRCRCAAVDRCVGGYSSATGQGECSSESKRFHSYRT